MQTDENVDILFDGAYHAHVLRFVDAAEIDKQIPFTDVTFAMSQNQCINISDMEVLHTLGVIHDVNRLYRIEIYGKQTRWGFMPWGFIKRKVE